MDTITLKFIDEEGIEYTKTLKQNFISCGFRREFNRYVHLLNQRAKVLQDLMVDENADSAKMLFEFNEFSTIEAIKMCQFIADTSILNAHEKQQFSKNAESDFWDVQDYDAIVDFNDNFRGKFGLTRTRSLPDSENGENS